MEREDRLIAMTEREAYQRANEAAHEREHRLAANKEREARQD